MPQSQSSSAGVVPKCRCGNGDMRLFTSHTKSNPNRKFWGCPKWVEGYGCGAFLWKDRVSVEHISVSDGLASDRGEIRIDMDELSSCFEELKREIQLQNRLLQMNMEGKNGKKHMSDDEIFLAKQDIFLKAMRIIKQLCGDKRRY